jgi:tetratricopeptide (TPR) repeat protein
MHGASAYDQGLKLSSQGRHLDAIVQFEQALAVRPDDAKVLFALGNTASALGLAGPAEEFFRRVLGLEPQRLEALVNLANLLRDRGQYDAAIALLKPHVQDCESPELLVTLGSAYRESGDHDAALLHTRAALDLRGDYAPALANLADMLGDSGDFEAARTLYDKAIRCDPKNAQARLNRAMLHLSHGALKDGWRDYAARVDIPGKVPVTEQRLAAWTGESLKNKRLLVRSEQGVGDEILFASLIPELAARAAAEGGKILLECDPRLTALFARSFPGVSVHPANIRTQGNVAVADYGWLRAAGGANAFVLAGSLPRTFRKTLADFPKSHTFLTPDADEAARWENVFGLDAIGICWRSGKTGGHRAIQYAPLETWGAALRDIPGTLVSVQYDATPEEIAALEKISGRKIVVPPDIDQKNELDRSAALLSALSCVISAPTAVSWLSAGVGTRTLKLLYKNSWTALGQDYEPFGPACRCVMPKQDGDWADGFAQVKTMLTARP